MTISEDAKDVAISVTNRLPAHFLWLALAAITVPAAITVSFVYLAVGVQTARIDGEAALQTARIDAVVKMVQACVASK